MNKTFKKILNITTDVLVVLIVLLAVFSTVKSFTQKQSENGMADFLGVSPLVVESESMAAYDPDTGKYGFNVGDLIIVDKVTLPTTGHLDLEVGDIITFDWTTEIVSENNDIYFNTHKIVEVISGSPYNTYRTHGINNPEGSFELVTEDDVVAVYTGVRIPAAGAVIKFVQSQTGFLVVIVLPVFIFFVYQGFVLFKAIKDNNQEKQDLAIAEATAKVEIDKEAMKEQLRKELEEEMRAKKAQEEKK